MQRFFVRATFATSIALFSGATVYGQQDASHFNFDDNWDCTSQVENSSGTISIGRCPSSSVIACYQEIKETCRERSSGKMSTRTYTSYTGACVSSYSDCW